MGVTELRAKMLLSPKDSGSFFHETATRPVLLRLDNKKPLSELSELKVS